METLAEHFKRFGDQHPQAMRLLGHPIPRDAKNSKRAADGSKNHQK
jgi:hypothetical protein